MQHPGLTPDVSTFRGSGPRPPSSQHQLPPPIPPHDRTTPPRRRTRPRSRTTRHHDQPRHRPTQSLATLPRHHHTLSPAGCAHPADTIKSVLEVSTERKLAAMASYTLAAFTLAALLALTILALSDANERADIALFGLAVPAVFWTVPPVVLRLTGYSASETVFFIALATAGFWVLLAGYQLRQALA